MGNNQGNTKRNHQGQDNKVSDAKATSEKQKSTQGAPQSTSSQGKKKQQANDRR